jgi:hypothetical protein
MTPQGKTWVAIIVIALVIGGGVWAYNSRSENSGRAVFGITDAAANLDTVESVMVTVDEVQVRAEGGQWVTVSEDDQEYDLMALKASGKAEVIADTELIAQTYDQVKIKLKDVTVKAKGKAEVEAHLPSNEMTLDTNLTVRPGQTSTAVMDVMLDLSLFPTSQDRYVLVPVVKTDTRTNADIQIGATEVNRTSGTMESSGTTGMDVDGSSKSDFALNSSTVLDLIGDGIIYIKSAGQNDTTLKITAQQALDKAEAEGSLDSQSSLWLSEQNGKKVWVIGGLAGSTNSSIGIDAITGAVVDLNSSTSGSGSSSSGSSGSNVNVDLNSNGSVQLNP